MVEIGNVALLTFSLPQNSRSTNYEDDYQLLP